MAHPVKLGHCCSLTVFLHFFSSCSLGLILLLSWLNGMKYLNSWPENHMLTVIRARETGTMHKWFTLATRYFFSWRRKEFTSPFFVQSVLAHVSSQSLSNIGGTNSVAIKRSEWGGDWKIQKSIKLTVWRPKIPI